MSGQTMKPVRAYMLLNTALGYNQDVSLKRYLDVPDTDHNQIEGVFVPQEAIDHIKGWLREDDTLPETHQWDKGFRKAVIETLKLIEPEVK